MGSLLFALPVVLCLALCAAAGVAAFVFRGSGKQSPDNDDRKDNSTHPIKRDLQN